MRNLVTLLAIIFATNSHASATRVIQADIINATGGASLSVPSTGSNIVSDSSTQTLTNKTISGSSNTLSNIPASAVSSGQVAVSNGGTGASTLTSNGIVFGNGTSAVGITAAGSQFQVYQAGASGVPTVGALNLGQAAAVTGQLPVASGGTGASTLTSGSAVVGNGTSAVSLVAPGTSGNVFTSNGSTWISSAPASTSPTISGSAASPNAITAGGGITFSGTNYFNIQFITGSAGAVTVTAVPSITNCTSAGQALSLVGESASNTVTLQDNANLAGSKLQLNGNWIAGLNSVLNLLCDAASGNWVETSRR